MTENMIDVLNNTPTNEQKQQLMVATMEGLKENDEWNADFSRPILQQKVKEFKQIKKKLVKQSPSSSSGIGQAIATGAQERAKQ